MLRRRTFDDYLGRAEHLVAYAPPADGFAEGRGDDKSQHKNGAEPEAQDIGDTGDSHCLSFVAEQFARHSLAEYRPNELADKEHDRNRREKGQVFMPYRPGVYRQAGRGPDSQDRIEAAE